MVVPYFFFFVCMQVCMCKCAFKRIILQCCIGTWITNAYQTQTITLKTQFLISCSLKLFELHLSVILMLKMKKKVRDSKQTPQTASGDNM